MATIVTIAASDLISNSRADLNTNFTNLNSDKIETSYLDTDTALAANSDSKIATQKATKAYVDAAVTGTTPITSGSFTKVLSSATATTIAHGIGAIPQMIRLTGVVAMGAAATVQSFAYATYVSSVQSSLSYAVRRASGTTGTTDLTQTFKLCGNVGDLGDYSVGVITVDATNLTITWTLTGSPTETANLVWEAIK